MKGKTRKLLATLMALAMVFSLFAGLPLTASAAISDYDLDDIAVIEAIIDNNGLAWGKATEETGTVDVTWMGDNWPGVTWDTATTQRIMYLDISDESLFGALDVTGLTALEYLDCYENSLTSLDVSGLTALELLVCGQNSLTSLDVSGLTALNELDCGDNSLTSLNVSGLTALEYLDCSYNNLTTLNVSGLYKLEYLYCNYNSLTSLNVSGLTALGYLNCSQNNLTELDVTDCVALTKLECSDNLIDSLTGLPTTLDYLYCSQNRLTGFDVTDLNDLNYLVCDHNYIDDNEFATPGTYITGVNAIAHFPALGWGYDSFGFSPQHDSSFKAALKVIDLPETVVTGGTLTLTGTVFPSDSTNNTITGWELHDTGGTGSTLYDNVLTAGTTTGRVEMYAVVEDGYATGVDLYYWFYIEVTVPATVNISVIPGVTAPATGASPKTVITDTAQYTGTITWSPSDAPFAASTVYTATITLTPEAGYTLTGVAADFFTVAGATSVSNAADSGVVTAEFPETGAASGGGSSSGGGSGGGGGGGSTPSNPSGSFSGGSAYVKGSTTGIIYIVSKDFAQFDNVRVDNNTLTQNTQYTAENGSTKIALLPAYLDTLVAGTHSMRVGFKDNTSATVQFTVAAEPTPITPTMPVNPFSDVRGTDWFIDDVIYAYDKGLIDGTSPTTFSPNSNLTYAQAITLAARMHQLYTKGEITLENGDDPWYQPYVDYAIENGIISGDYDWDAMATRAGYMQIFANALPDEAYAQINDVPDGSIPDVPMDYPGAAAIYKLYRAGILQGNDDTHKCSPDNNIRRSEVAAILTRMMNPDTRISFSM